MIVASILNGKGVTVLSVTPDMSVRDAARFLRDKRIGAAVVLDGDRALIGILSERDVLNGVADRGASALAETVRDIMTVDVPTCGLTTPIGVLMTTMTDRRVRHLPVVENDRVVGVVSIGDVVKSRIAEAETEAEALKAYIASG